jgi:hypothetical protein
VAREESRTGKTELKKRLSPRLSRFAGDGCLKIEMSNDAAGRATRPNALGGKSFFADSSAGGRRAAIISTLIETAKLNDVAGLLSSSLLREAFKNDHGRRIAL